jgi:hypothetical protein
MDSGNEIDLYSDNDVCDYYSDDANINTDATVADADDDAMMMMMMMIATMTR